jgi:hypothetical protein
MRFSGAHGIFNLLSCGSKQLSAKVNLSVRRFRYRLAKLENFPFFAFSFASPTELLVELDTESHDYAVLCGKRDLLPLKPIKSLKKLSFGFAQSSLLLRCSLIS